MDFITDNYIFIIVGIILILMTFIGYLADKTDFGRKKSVKTKKESKPKEEQKPTKIKVDAKGINDLSNDINDVNKLTPKKEENKEEIDKSLFEPLETPKEEQKNKTVEENKIETPKEVKNTVEEEDIWKF